MPQAQFCKGNKQNKGKKISRKYNLHELRFNCDLLYYILSYSKLNSSEPPFLVMD